MSWCSHTLSAKHPLRILMPKSTALLKKHSETSKSATLPTVGGVFKISLKGIPKVDAKTKVRLEAAARSPESTRRDYPEVIAD
jgi:hypothetical protein